MAVTEALRAEVVANDREVAEIERLQEERRLTLAFGPALEKSYALDFQQRAAAAFRYGSVLVFVLYALLGTGIYVFMPDKDTHGWLVLYAGVGGVILLAGVLSHFRRLDRWFNVYMGLCSFVAVTLSVAVMGVVADPQAEQLTQATIMYAMVVVYGVVGLRFQHAMLAGWMGGLAGSVLATVMGSGISWEILLRTYMGSSLLGMFMVYYAERRDRDMFLQSRLLQIAKWRTERYAHDLDLLSRQDALTALANRRHFDETLEQEWRRAGRHKSSLAILMIDVDNFKHYNDKLGHPEGDRCLRRVANLLAGHARRPGELVARYGGEEFVMIFPDTDHQQAVNLAEHVLDSVRRALIPQPDGLERWYVTISIGVSSTVPSERMTPSRLLVAADQALYEVKRNGRNSWWYLSPELQAAQAAPAKPASWVV